VGASLAVDYTLRNPLVLMNVWILVGAAIAASEVPDAPDVIPAPQTRGVELGGVLVTGGAP
jgi:hypothetical protein